MYNFKFNKMSTVKSFSVGEGDMFYIQHDSDNFTTIDCCLYKKDNVKDAIFKEIKEKSKGKGITRFISTHPDDDHISGLKDYEDEFGIANFYRVDNEATKKDESDDFNRYCSLRDDSKKSFTLKKGCSRKWMNEKDETRGSSGLNCLWPITSNEKYKTALQNAKDGKSPNDISPAIRYSREGGFSFLFMGDMETGMQEEFDSKVTNEHTSVVFAPHHGRKSGKIPQSLLEKLTPKIIVVGEAPSEDLEYYKNYNTITQNSAGDIRFEVGSDYIDIYVSEKNYTKKAGMVTNINAPKNLDSMYYLGSIKG